MNTFMRPGSSVPVKAIGLGSTTSARRRSSAGKGMGDRRKVGDALPWIGRNGTGQVDVGTRGRCRLSG